MLFYRIILTLLLPVLVAQTVWQRLRGTMPQGAVAERLALRGGFSAGPVLWLHGASNGELTSLRWLLARLLAEHPALRVVVSCNSASARQMALDWALPQLRVTLAPYDSYGSARRFLARWRPNALLLVENELWPERLYQMAPKGPVMVIGARMSEGSARNWQRFAPGLMAGMLHRVCLLSAQDAASERRFLGLGLPKDRLGPRLMLKSRVAAAAQQPAPFALQVPRARCVLAGSTHEGEDADILAAFARARAEGRFDLLILAPRHPRRSAALVSLIEAHGLPYAIRSAGQEPGPDTAVYLADTLGEMAHWYEMAGVTIIGGTFGDAGGHTPFEPAAHGSALIHGPSVSNFSEAFGALDAAGAAIALPDGASLAAALCGPIDQNALADAARTVLTPAGDEAALLAALSALIRPTDGQAISSRP